MKLSDYPTAEVSHHFQSEDDLDKFTGFPKEIFVKACAAKGKGETPTAYKESPLYQAIKAVHPNLLVAVTAESINLQLRVGVWATYEYTEAQSPALFRDFMRGKDTPEHWVRLKMKYQQRKA